MAKKRKCPKCGGPARGRGYTHKPTCADYQGRTASQASSSSVRIDGRTPTAKLLKLQAAIHDALDAKDKAEVRAVKKAIAEVDSLREQLAEAESLAGL